MPGYTGMNCSSKCPYPSFGRKCQELCNCSENQCDISRGCNSLTSGNVHLDVSVMLILQLSLSIDIAKHKSILNKPQRTQIIHIFTGVCDLANLKK